VFVYVCIALKRDVLFSLLVAGAGCYMFLEFDIDV
jgi:hypothetical protein